MPPDQFSLKPEEKSPGGVVSVLLSLSFGFIVWCAHFLLIYGITAYACSPLSSLGEQGLIVKSVLLALTVAALALVAAHGWGHYGRADDDSNGRDFVSFLNTLLDGAAAIAILWQMFPIIMIPLCL